MIDKTRALEEFTDCVFDKMQRDRYGVNGCSSCENVDVLSAKANLFKFIDTKYCSIIPVISVESFIQELETNETLKERLCTLLAGCGFTPTDPPTDPPPTDPNPTCNIVIGTSTTSITSSTANFLFNYTGSIPDRVEYSTNNGQSWSVVNTAQIDNSSSGIMEVFFSNLSNGTYTYSFRFRCALNLYSNTVQKSFTVNVVTNPGTPACNKPTNVALNIVNKIKAFYGWKDDNSPLTLAQIEATLTQYEGLKSDAVIADYRINNLSKFLWVAIPVNAPDVTTWYGTVDNNGNVGTPTDLFGAPVIIQSKYKLYMTNYKTKNTATVIEFRHP